MAIDFDAETSEITSKPKQVEGCLDCEKSNSGKYPQATSRRNNNENIIRYLKRLPAWFENKIIVNQLRTDCTNYRYATGFVNTLLKMPCWRNWMKTIDM